MTRRRQVWLPPAPRPDNESAGYLGYYARTHCDLHFDLVDGDGSVPVVWYYRKSETMVRRVFEEKPSHQRQALHPSEDRVLRDLAATWARNGGVWVIWRAERLARPEFPITVQRLAVDRSGDRKYTYESKDEFDDFLLAGLAEPPVPLQVNLLDPDRDSYSVVLDWLRNPYTHTGNEGEIDDLVTQFADAIRRLARGCA